MYYFYISSTFFTYVVDVSGHFFSFESRGKSQELKCRLAGSSHWEVFTLCRSEPSIVNHFFLLSTPEYLLIPHNLLCSFPTFFSWVTFVFSSTFFVALSEHFFFFSWLLIIFCLIQVFLLLFLDSFLMSSRLFCSLSFIPFGI